MQVNISTKGISLTEHLHEFVDRRLRFALERFNSVIDLVEINLSDENGPRGGIDKRCRMVVRTRFGKSLIVESDDQQIEAAVARAADRMGRSVSRALGRVRQSKHTSRRRAE